MNIEEMAKAITTITAAQLSEANDALENDIEQASRSEYPYNILSPKEYGMILMKRRRKK